MADRVDEQEAKRAPVNGPPGGTISWAEHQRAWIAYARTYGTDQSAERIAQRGGFGVSELVTQLGHMPRTWLPGPGTRFLRGVTCDERGAEVTTCDFCGHQGRPVGRNAECGSCGAISFHQAPDERTLPGERP